MSDIALYEARQEINLLKEQNIELIKERTTLINLFLKALTNDGIRKDCIRELENLKQKS